MTQILIIYASDFGNTEKMAQATADGVRSVNGAQPLVKKAEEVTKEDMKNSDGILFGSPVHMGSMAWQMKKFIDRICSGLWMKDSMNGKVAGVFMSGGGFGGSGAGAELAMLSMLNNIAELGMLIVPLPKNTALYTKGGLHWGPYGRSADEAMEHTGVTDDALAVCRTHGANVTRAAAALKDQTVFAA
ncbi:flavodoxin [Desulfomarina profundi]|uniref:Flavodoxin n=1 Tax=Desulfomarina profundi TaxID=2772557 RepID=A0A8D5FRI3_9BACT|nr:NAD(P)H-dependent oxidoreductase [Desulfomarina profundi]BCL60086.1 flavodoxin [Desulfomarina profundi]